MEQTYLGTIPSDLLRQLHAGWHYEVDCYRREGNFPPQVSFHLLVKIPLLDDVESFELRIDDISTQGWGEQYRDLTSRIGYILETLEQHSTDTDRCGNVTYALAGSLRFEAKHIVLHGRLLPRLIVPTIAAALRRAISEPHPIIVRPCIGFDMSSFEVVGGTDLQILVDGKVQAPTGSYYRLDWKPGTILEVHDSRPDRRCIVPRDTIVVESSDPHIRRFRRDS